MKVIGVQRNIGEYKGNNYDKIKFICTYPITKNGSGDNCEIVSIKTDLCDELLQTIDGEIDMIVGMEIKFDYNKFGQPVSIKEI